MREKGRRKNGAIGGQKKKVACTKTVILKKRNMKIVVP